MQSSHTLKGVVFDLGWTLIHFDGVWDDVLEESNQALAAYLQQQGFPIEYDALLDKYGERKLESYRKRSKDNIERTTASVVREVMAAFGHNNLADELVKGAVEAFYQVSEVKWEPMPRVHEVLERIKAAGLKVGMISNAGDTSNVHRLISNAGIDASLFDPLIVSAAVGIRKPAPAIFQMVLDEWDLDPKETVMIGDMLGADIIGAQRTGMHTIWVTLDADHKENHQYKHTISPEFSVTHLYEIMAILSHLHGKPL